MRFSRNALLLTAGLGGIIVIFNTMRKRARRAARRAALGGAVLVEERAGAVPSSRQRLELSTAELAIVKISMFMQGSMRIGFVLSVSGSVTASQLEAGRAAIQASHPALRCAVALAGGGEASVSSTFVLEVQDKLELPITVHSASTEAGDAAWLPVWASIEKVCLKLDCCCV